MTHGRKKTGKKGTRLEWLHNGRRTFVPLSQPIQIGGKPLKGSAQRPTRLATAGEPSKRPRSARGGTSIRPNSSHYYPQLSQAPSGPSPGHHRLSRVCPRPRNTARCGLNSPSPRRPPRRCSPRLGADGPRDASRPRTDVFRAHESERGEKARGPQPMSGPGERGNFASP